jgi:hypothetical protein
MNQDDGQLESPLEAQNRKHQKAMQKTAKQLLEKGIVRVHYAMDFVNDDGDAAEYAVLEYEDGGIEELDGWFEDLDQDVFLWGLKECLPYTFDARAVRISVDQEGGSVDTEDNAIRMYHTDARRQQLEAEAEEAKFELYSYEHYDELNSLAASLKARGIARVYFGIDQKQGMSPIADWGFLEFENGDQKTLDHFPDELEDIRELIEELPQIGAFQFDIETQMIEADSDGGILEFEDDTIIAFHTEVQRLAFEAARA